jgi:hypothetical protein
LAEEIRPNDRNQKFFSTSNHKQIFSSSFLMDRKAGKKKQDLTQKKSCSICSTQFVDQVIELEDLGHRKRAESIGVAIDQRRL